jgi:hypothetical protein
MSQAKPRRKKGVEPLDWRELAEAPALRGLNEALSPLREPHQNVPDARLMLVRDAGTADVPLTGDASFTVGAVPTVGVPPSVGFPPTVGVPPTAGGTVAVAPAAWLDTNGKVWDPKRIRPVILAQHSMTQGERILYEALWHCRESNGIGKFKIFSLGYDRIARIASVDEKTVRVSVPKLITKRILDLVAGENSATRTGRTYRIYSYEAILERQRAAGLTTVVRNGKAVEFVWRVEGAMPTVGVSPTAGVTPTLGRTPTAQPPKYPEDLPARIRHMMPSFDHQALNRLWEACNQRDPACSSDEVVHCFELKLGASQGKDTPVGFMLKMVPLLFEGADSEHRAFRIKQQAERERHRKRLLFERQEVRERLEKPGLDAEDREYYADRLRHLDEEVESD